MWNQSAMCGNSSKQCCETLERECDDASTLSRGSHVRKVVHGRHRQLQSEVKSCQKPNTTTGHMLRTFPASTRSRAGGDLLRSAVCVCV